MSDDERQRGRPASDRTMADVAWSIMSYLLGGMAVWGGAGWLVDRALGLRTLFFPIGVLVGVAGALYLGYVRSRS